MKQAMALEKGNKEKQGERAAWRAKGGAVHHNDPSMPANIGWELRGMRRHLGFQCEPVERRPTKAEAAEPGQILLSRGFC
ncbi:MAG TPA: hypothetical protein DCZ75_11460 [Geobacter sp.]|nr:hypothetical protein [Geobacter sp.]